MSCSKKASPIGASHEPLRENFKVPLFSDNKRSQRQTRPTILIPRRAHRAIFVDDGHQTPMSVIIANTVTIAIATECSVNPTNLGQSSAKNDNFVIPFPGMQPEIPRARQLENVQLSSQCCFHRLLPILCL